MNNVPLVDVHLSLFTELDVAPRTFFFIIVVYRVP
jgi:hypothetical protein